MHNSYVKRSFSCQNCTRLRIKMWFLNCMRAITRTCLPSVIILVNNSAPIMAFSEYLRSALIDSMGAKCTLPNSTSTTATMGKHVLSRRGHPQLTTWLAEGEESGRIALFVADSGERSLWTKACIRQADCIFLVGEADEDSSVGECERILINVKTTARKELVLLHSERRCASGVTRSWLKVVNLIVV